MGKLVIFPCRDEYEEWNYEDYYANDKFEDGNCGWNGEVLVKDSLIRGFIRKCLMFVLVRL